MGFLISIGPPPIWPMLSSLWLLKIFVRILIVNICQCFVIFYPLRGMSLWLSPSLWSPLCLCVSLFCPSLSLRMNKAYDPICWMTLPQYSLQHKEYCCYNVLARPFEFQGMFRLMSLLHSMLLPRPWKCSLSLLSAFFIPESTIMSYSSPLTSIWICL